IPRPETETIVEHVLLDARLSGAPPAPRVLDLCTGSGCLAAAIAYHLKSCSVLGIDISPQAIDVARRNIARLQLEARVVLTVGDLFEPLRSRITAAPFDLIVANPPYIPSGHIDSLDRNVRDYEPRIALDGGADGLEIIRRILSEAAQRLQPGGRCYVEIQFDQAAPVLELARAAGLVEARVVKDHGGRDRVLIASAPR
ncbi:MAG: peptide chain release factor N(5)-glutamine methyltransferase, partial [Phycisphaerae bacterium]|nr:peptide chain release factor N(5)-glutamine methyltransferase [Phycisphaerae bacterium]